MEHTCGDGGKQSLHLNKPAVFVFNSTVNTTKFSCHLELHLHSQSLGFSVFLDTLKLSSFMNSDCSRDYLQFGRDRLFITTHLSDKYCQEWSKNVLCNKQQIFKHEETISFIFHNTYS